jgi:DNA-binding response OmpR family regulator
MTLQPRVLLAEDDDDVRVALADGLRQDGNEVVEVPDGNKVKSYIDDCVLCDVPAPRVHVLVTDLRMPGVSGLGLLSYLKDLGLELPTVVVTAFGDRETRNRAQELGATAVLDKPIELSELQKVVRSALGDAWADPDKEPDPSPG